MLKSDKKILDEWKSKFQRGFLRIIIFRMFHQIYKTDELLTGNVIREKIDQRTGGKWKPSPGSVYPILLELENDRIIEERITGNQKNKEYQLTEFGSQLFDKIIEETLAFSPHNQSKKDIHSPKFRERVEWGLSKMSTRQLKVEYERNKVMMNIIGNLLKQKILEDPLLD
jgi:DNA-binding PadR family transcriptional regulator